MLAKSLALSAPAKDSTTPDGSGTPASDAVKLAGLRAALAVGARSPLVMDFSIAKLQTRLDEAARRRG